VYYTYLEALVERTRRRRPPASPVIAEKAAPDRRQAVS